MRSSQAPTSQLDDLVLIDQLPPEGFRQALRLEMLAEGKLGAI